MDEVAMDAAAWAKLSFGLMLVGLYLVGSIKERQLDSANATPWHKVTLDFGFCLLLLAMALPLSEGAGDALGLSGAVAVLIGITGKWRAANHGVPGRDAA